MDATLVDAQTNGKTIRFEDAGPDHYMVTVDSWNNHIALTISKDEVKWIVETSEQEGK